MRGRTCDFVTPCQVRPLDDPGRAKDYPGRGAGDRGVGRDPGLGQASTAIPAISRRPGQGNAPHTSLDGRRSAEGL